MATLNPGWGLGPSIAIVATVAIGCLLVILVRTTRVEVRWTQDGWAAVVSLAVRVWRFRITLFRKELDGVLGGSKATRDDADPGPQAGGDSSTRPHEPRKRKRSGRASLQLALRTIRTVERLQLDARIGLEDAMLVSVLVGAGWAVTGILLPILESQIAFSSPPRIHLVPLYNQPTVQVKAVCIFHIRLGDIVWETAKRAWQERSGKEGSPIGKPAASH